MPSEQHLPYRSTADVVVLDGDGSRWVRETNRTCPNAIGTCPDNVLKNVPFSPNGGGSSPIASPTASRDAGLARRLMVNEFRYASTGAYRHVDALDVISGAIGVDAEGKYSSEIERGVYARLADIIEGSVSALTGPRKRTRKVEAWCVVDFGGVYGCSWVHPVRAFTDRCKASVCRYIREQRREKPRNGVSRPIDYIGSCVRKIEVVIDE